MTFWQWFKKRLLTDVVGFFILILLVLMGGGFTGIIGGLIVFILNYNLGLFNEPQRLMLLCALPGAILLPLWVLIKSYRYETRTE